MDNFKFHGRIYEVTSEEGSPRRVLTNVSENITNTTCPSEIIGRASVSEVVTPGGESQQTLSLALDSTKITGPQGPQGLQGPPLGVGTATITSYLYTTTENPSVTITPSASDNSKLDFNFKVPYPNIHVVGVNSLSPGATPGVSVQRINYDRAPDPGYVGLTFSIPQGETGHTPVIGIDNVETLSPESDAYVQTISPAQGSPGDVRLKFGIPKGHPGEKGDKGDPFVVAKVYPTRTAMIADYNNIYTGTYVVIGTDVDSEENAQLYWKPTSFNKWTYEDDRTYVLRDANNFIIEELDFIGDFSGARGAHAEVYAGNATTLKSNESATVTATGPSYVVTADAWQTFLNFGIPKGASAKVTGVTVSTVNSNQSATVTCSNTYDSSNDINKATISFGIPKGASAKVGQVDVSTISSTQSATVTYSNTYDSSNDINKATITFGIPRGASATLSSTVNVTTVSPSANATGSISNSYNSSLDTNVGTLSLSIPRGQIPELTIGTVTSGDTASANIAYTTTGDYSQARLNLTLPRGEQGIDGELVSINTISPSNTFVGAIGINANNPGILDVTKVNITNADLPSTISASKISGTLSASNIPTLSASQITTGTFDIARIPTIPTSSISGTISIANGGTGATTSAGARTNLGVYSTTEVDELFSNYDTTSSVTSLLENYYTSSAVDSLLSSYATTSAVSSAIATYAYSKSDVDAAIASATVSVTVSSGIITVT